MKTLSDGHHVFRMTDDEAKAAMAESPGVWHFIPKKFWKAERVLAVTRGGNATVQEIAEFLRKAGIK